MRRLLAAAFVALVFAPSPAPATPADPLAGILGRWDMTLRHEGHELPGWFEIATDDHGLVVTYQGLYGAPEHIHSASFARGVLEFSTAEFGDVRGHFNGTWFAGDPDPRSESRAPAWTAVRAPVLGGRQVAWGRPVTLFDGRSLEGWHTRFEGASGWSVRDGALAVVRPRNDLVSDRLFKDFKLHLQYRLEPDGDSGVHLRGRYEIQLTDRSELVGAAGASGAVYGHLPPAVSAQKPAGEWNTLEVTLVGRWLTATLNGQVIHDEVEIPGITGDALDSAESRSGPIVLQGHLGAVAFRDVVVTPAR